MAKPLSEFATFLLEQLAPMGHITAKNMFGGYAICKHGLAFALVIHDEAYFKVDDSNRADYEALGSEPFTYAQRSGKVITVQNWRLPAHILEDSDALLPWAEAAYQVALRKAKQ